MRLQLIQPIASTPGSNHTTSTFAAGWLRDTRIPGKLCRRCHSALTVHCATSVCMPLAWSLSTPLIQSSVLSTCPNANVRLHTLASPIPTYFHRLASMGGSILSTSGEFRNLCFIRCFLIFCGGFVAAPASSEMHSTPVSAGYIHVGSSAIQLVFAPQVSVMPSIASFDVY